MIQSVRLFQCENIDHVSGTQDIMLHIFPYSEHVLKDCCDILHL